ncbi:TetR/AcrR family transcriptional regulator [Actinomadura alba]|uniref:TetR/AcrR family transcriptional regulator n=1 Tax=Actinomadura alba TaxID=406431 RepID=A0ABR7LIP5_9ACTN|nr:TetR/AcrR family transcriptional regulator [Actinomadura alba]MBC6464719.1 TetR/AcrR family transcriptional regulator [Actinomadura alba]
MVRLTRAQQQERTRAAVLAAAREEFAEHGYVEAKVDRIAERAELTRGAVYSNFPSKRALYLAVLVDMVEHTGTGQVPVSSPGPAEALGAFARVWLERLPLGNDTRAGGHLQLRSLAGVLDDEPARTALAHVTRLEALLLALALESRVPPPTGQVRRVRLAELVLTLLNGSGHLADTAPGFGDPFDVARACEHLAGIDLADTWHPPHLPYVPPARPCRDTWVPPPELPDQITGRRVGFDADGVIAVLGTSRLGAAEEVVRAAGPGDSVTVAVVTSDRAENGRLVRLRISDLTGCLRRVFAPDAWPRLHLVLDDHALVASAIGASGADDATEAAVRVQEGRIVARAHWRGAAHAAATAGASNTARPHEAGR